MSLRFEDQVYGVIRDLTRDAVTGGLCWTGSTDSPIGSSDFAYCADADIENPVRINVPGSASFERVAAYGGDVFIATSGTGIQRCNGANGCQIIVPTSPEIHALAIDPLDEKIYWSDHHPGTHWRIQRANLDGTGIELWMAGFLLDPKRIVIDSIHRRIYWTDSTNIFHASVDGLIVSSLNSGPVTNAAFALDAPGGKVYWRGAFAIYRANLDGSQSENWLPGGPAPSCMLIVPSDCNANGVPDLCDTIGGVGDCTGNRIPDECEPDCDADAIADTCEIAGGTASDCNANGTPDECDIAAGLERDDDLSGVPDVCERTRVFVKSSATGANDGSSWTDAYVDLQDALIVTRGTGSDLQEVWVAGGVYKPDRGTADRRMSFSVGREVSILGGFAGNDSNPANRDPATNLTTLSGDIDAPNNVTGNSYHVFQVENASGLVILDGLTISGGLGKFYLDHGSDAEYSRGGGLHIKGSQVLLRGVSLLNNRAGFGAHCAANDGPPGGAIYCAGGATLVMEDCTLQSNRAGSGSPPADEFESCVAGLQGGFGGAVYCTDGSTFTARRCTFRQNYGGFARVGGRGGAVALAGVQALIEDSLFDGNQSGAATGLTGAGGAIVSDAGSTLIVRRCSFFSNRTPDGNTYELELLLSGGSGGSGGAIYAAGATIIRDSVFGSNRTGEGGDTGCYPEECSAGSGGSGGAVWCAGPNCTVVNCTFFSNVVGAAGHGSGHMGTPGTGGGLRATGIGDGVVVSNNIFWQNLTNQFSGNAIATYNIISDLAQPDGNGNINVNPLFVNTGARDFRLQPGSGAIDAGDPTFVPLFDTLDLGGEPRLQNCRVDIGAYESPGPIPHGDMEDDGDVDLVDFTGFQICRDFYPTHVPEICEPFDLDCDDDIDLLDFRGFQVAFGN